jgi:uncharacterized membrane protein
MKSKSVIARPRASRGAAIPLMIIQAITKQRYPFLICTLFFIAYSVLAVVRHLHFLSGYDFAVVDQAIWKYSQFKAPISTNITYAFTPLLWDHVELTFPFLAPIYWFTNNPAALFVLQAAAATYSGMAVFLLAKRKQLISSICYALLIPHVLWNAVCVMV